MRKPSSTGQKTSDLRQGDVFLRAGRYREEIEDASSSRRYRFVPFLGSGTGGSSALYGMALERFHSADFEPGRHHRDADGSTVPDRWPITYSELSPYYEAAEKLFGVRGTPDPLRDDAPMGHLLPPPRPEPRRGGSPRGPGREGPSPLPAPHGLRVRAGVPVLSELPLRQGLQERQRPRMPRTRPLPLRGGTDRRVRSREPGGNQGRGDGCRLPLPGKPGDAEGKDYRSRRRRPRDAEDPLPLGLPPRGRRDWPTIPGWSAGI